VLIKPQLCACRKTYSRQAHVGMAIVDVRVRVLADERNREPSTRAALNAGSCRCERVDG
jgi:hypothetical protein